MGATLLFHTFGSPDAHVGQHPNHPLSPFLLQAKAAKQGAIHRYRYAMTTPLVDG